MIGVNKMSNIVQQLIDGQAEIDRMRKEIKKVVLGLLGMTSGFHSRIASLDSREWIRFSYADCSWCLYRANAGEVAVDFVSGRSLVGVTSIYTTITKDYKIDPKWVKLTHSMLQIFVDGMLSTFPELAEKLEPFINAAADK